MQTHKTHTASQRKYCFTITHSVNRSGRLNLLARKTWPVMTHAATTGRWTTTSSQGADAQPVNRQPAGNTRHQHQARSSQTTASIGRRPTPTWLSNCSLVTQQGWRNTSQHETRTAPENQSCRKHRFRANSPSKSLNWSFGKQGILFESHSYNSILELHKEISNSLRPDVCSIEQLT